MLNTSELFDLEQTMAGDYLRGFKYPWQALEGISKLIVELISKLNKEEYKELGEMIWVHNSAVISETASITGPCIVGANTEVRHNAFIRGNALIGDKCVVGNSTELKNVILFNNVQVPHYNYVGDSILGHYAHMGAGSITSNVKADQSHVVIKSKDQSISSERKKVGAMLGDHVEIGCNSVLNPGTVIGKHSNVYPLTSVRGVIEENSIVKSMEEVILKK